MRCLVVGPSEEPERGGSLMVARPRATLGDAWCLRDRFRSYSVLVDGVREGKLPYGATCTVALAPGSHSVRVVLDRLWKSRELASSVEPGSFFIRVSSGLGRTFCSAE